MLKVVQCWDDGVVTDERLTNILRKYNATATFNLNPGAMQENRSASTWVRPFEESGWTHKGFRAGRLGLKDIAKVYDGFELASHCWLHETADLHSVEVFVKAALDARHYLEDIAQKDCLGFAWPCGRTTPESIVAMREAGFAYGRTTLNSREVTKCADTMALAASCHFHDSDFWSLYRQAKECDGVFYFWGHSYEMFEYDTLWDQFEQTIKAISEDPDSEWVNIMDIIPMCHS